MSEKNTFSVIYCTNKTQTTIKKNFQRNKKGVKEARNLLKDIEFEEGVGTAFNGTLLAKHTERYWLIKLGINDNPQFSYNELASELLKVVRWKRMLQNRWKKLQKLNNELQLNLQSLEKENQQLTFEKKEFEDKYIYLLNEFNIVSNENDDYRSNYGVS